jgi:dienelactone hydrolase
MVHLLETQQLQDQMAALAWLEKQPFAKGEPVAVMGNSFGGVETVLGASNSRYCAAIDAAGGAESWGKAPALQRLMLGAVRRAKIPILFIQARNDYTVAPSEVLYKEMDKVGKSAAIRIFPTFGTSAVEGHSFAWRGGKVWASTVFPFLDKYCGR